MSLDCLGCRIIRLDLWPPIIRWLIAVTVVAPQSDDHAAASGPLPDLIRLILSPDGFTLVVPASGDELSPI